MNKNLFTTYEIAKLCSVDVTTIKNWINSRKLSAYKTPGGHRRVKKEDLVEFLRKYEMPIPPQIEGKGLKVLIVDDDRNIVDIITRALKKQKWDLRIEPAYDGYEAGTKVTTIFPDLVILNKKRIIYRTNIFYNSLRSCVSQLIKRTNNKRIKTISRI